jgi:hypothetical protein
LRLAEDHLLGILLCTDEIHWKAAGRASRSSVAQRNRGRGTLNADLNQPAPNTTYVVGKNHVFVTDSESPYDIGSRRQPGTRPS